MARPLRIEYPGAFYHVINRGIERRPIFLDRHDYTRFLDLCRTLHTPFKFLVHSYCLMPNHYHLLLETPEGNLSRLMQQLNGKYSQFFNRRHRRVGPLFQGRYKAILLDQDQYALALSRYIHLNPVKAKLVTQPEAYEWSSYAVFRNLREPEPCLATHWLLSQVAGPLAEARTAFHRFTLEGLGDTWDPAEAAQGGSLLGDDAFVDEVKARWVPQQADRSISRLREIQKPRNLDAIADAVAKLSPDPKLQRKLMLYAARTYTALTLREIGAYMGGMSDVAVCQTVRRLAQEHSKNPALGHLLDKLEVAMGPR